jgi:hypothetical protein
MDILGFIGISQGLTRIYDKILGKNGVGQHFFDCCC